MPQTNESPGARGTGATKIVQLGGQNNSDDTPSPTTLQARTLIRRFGISPVLALLMAELAFSDGRAAS